ncbi:MAG: TetR/AcrR family transcriptional regulator [Rhodobacteraceae bacterium]|nr:TetR/AcrR family transcriptional regulator [Paracoccaceae bacterium]
MARRSDHSRRELKEMAIKAACRIITEGGLKSLSIRRIATAMGYTSGTLYQLFENLDELILEVIISTVEDMYSELAALKTDNDPEADLLLLALGYRNYSIANKNRWNAVFVYSQPDAKPMPERYQTAVQKLVGLAAHALEPIFRNHDHSDELAFQEARVLWASLYGIVSLDSAQKLSNFEPIDDIIASLVTNYVAGLRAGQV